MVKVVVVPLPITPSDLLAKFLLPVPFTLFTTGLDVLVLRWAILVPGSTTIIPLNWKLRFHLGDFLLFIPQSKQAKQALAQLPLVVNSDCPKKLDYYFTVEKRKMYLKYRRSLKVPPSIIIPCY